MIVDFATILVAEKKVGWQLMENYAKQTKMFRLPGVT